MLDVYVPILVAFSIAMLALNALPMVLAGYREQGVLRRLQTTPVGPGPGARRPARWSTSPSRRSRCRCSSLVARIAFGVPLPRQPAGFVLAALLAAAALMAIGLFVAAVAPTAGPPRRSGRAVLPADVLRRAVAADRHHARRPAAHQPRHPARRGGAGPAPTRPQGHWPHRAAAGDPGGLRGGVRAGRGSDCSAGSRLHAEDADEQSDAAYRGMGTPGAAAASGGDRRAVRAAGASWPSLTVAIKHSAAGSLVIDLALCALAAAWMLWMFTLHPAWRERPRVMARVLRRCSS